jgi:predicted ATPase/class 3 adenylate cyclase/Tfp pilus assembly protein PilF
MSSLPSGTVTLLFTDIEGSTRLLRELGDDYAALLERHNQVVRRACEHQAGVEVGTYGDSFFVAFRTAPQAAVAAVEAQRGLAGLGLAVRMGLHTGSPLLAGDDYVGLDVHRAARICAAAHGGQVLLSQVTSELVTAQVRDVGEHRLKDLAEPQRLFQLLAPGLREDFPPPRSLGGRIPHPSTRLVGRRLELAELEGLVEAGTRLLTLLGPGGIGKTRLALELAAEASARLGLGVYVVEAAALDDLDLLREAIGRELGIGEGGLTAGSLAEHVLDRETLLVLDNLEQLDAAPLAVELLAAAPRLRILATSRVPLRVAGEYRYEVRPLSDREGVELFLARARSAGASVVDDHALHEICARLDGLPLAIELAAARARVYPPAALLRRLDRRLWLLTGGPRDAPERQRTLRAAIAWSFDLLEEPEQEAVAALAVFQGGFTFEAAEEVAGAGAELVEALVERSLVRAEERGGEPRFQQLETIREFGRERLESLGRSEAAARLHAEHFARLAADAEQALTGSEQEVWLDRLEREHENLRAALRYAHAHDLELGLVLTGSLWRYWEARNHLREIGTWLDAAFEDGADSPTPGRARALLVAGRISTYDGRYEAAVAQFERSLEIARTSGDDFTSAFALAQLGWIEIARGDYAKAERLCREAVEIARAAADPWMLGSTLAILAGALLEQGELEAARGLLRESVVEARKRGDKRALANQLMNVAWAGIVASEPAEARLLYEESLELARELDDVTLVASGLYGLGLEANEAGDRVRARSLLAEALELQRETGERQRVAETFAELALAVAEVDPALAARLLGVTEARYGELGTAPPARDEERLDRTRAAVRGALGEELYERELDAGRGLGLDQAFDAALAA